MTSSGSSNRIEGNKLSDLEVEKLYNNLRIRKLKSRDEKEIVGYIEILDHIFKNYSSIIISESSICQIHSDMLFHSDHDNYHRGKYKVSSNRVEAKDQSGKIIGIIFDPTPPYLVKKEMHELIDWYHWAIEKKIRHPLILIANFLFEYLAIHPFQDGNGRTSRLLANLMLLRQGYEFVSFVSQEQTIEANKADYYLSLNKTQGTWKKDIEDISPWLLFFLKIVKKQAQKAMKILEEDQFEDLLSEKQLTLWNWAKNLENRMFSRKDAVKALGFPERTVESIIKKLFEIKKLQRKGQGKATRYLVII